MRYFLNTKVRFSINIGFSFFAFLGSNHNYAICTSRTINCCRRGIFENLNRFNIFRVQQRSSITGSHWKTIYNNQRICSSSNRRSTSHFYRTTTSRCTTLLHYLNTRHLSGNGLLKTGYRHVFYLLLFKTGD